MAVYRNDATLARIRLLFVIVAVIGVGAGGLGVIRTLDDPGGGSLWASITLAVIGLLAVVTLRRIRQVGVETTDEGIVVRNVGTTRRIAWSDIEAFGETGASRGVTEAVVRTRSGRAYPLSACGDPGPACHRILTALRRELEDARTP